jgi:hypothetical protein
MEIPFIGKLEAQEVLECSIRDNSRLLKYVMMNGKGDTSSICEDCRDNILRAREKQDSDLQ